HALVHARPGPRRPGDRAYRGEPAGLRRRPDLAHGPDAQHPARTGPGTAPARGPPTRTRRGPRSLAVAPARRCRPGHLLPVRRTHALAGRPSAHGPGASRAARTTRAAAGLRPVAGRLRR